MKKIIMQLFYFTFLLLFCAVKSYSQFGWYPLNSGTTQNLNFIFYNATNNKMYIVGDSGIILTSDYIGHNWTRVPSGTTSNLNSVSYFYPYYYISGDNGIILKSSNGTSWSALSSGTVNNLNSIFCSSQFGVSAGDNGTILRTTNQGINWLNLNTGMNTKFNSVSNSLIAGNSGTILKSTNQGLNWISSNSNTTSNLNFTDYSFIVGDNGTILKSNDFGYNWYNLNSGTNENLNSLAQYSNYVWAAGNNGTIIKSSDNGNIWIHQLTNTSEKLNSIIFPFYNFNTGLAVGNYGIILKTTTNTTNLDSRTLDANQISTWFRNNGSFNRDPQTGNGGFEWPIHSGLYARYTSGLWLGCKVGNDTITSVSEYGSDYTNGYIDNSGNPAGQSDTAYRIYKIIRGDSSSSDYLNWPVNQGAYINSHGRPFFLGTQSMFYVYIDSYSHSSGQTDSIPLKAQVLQTNWAYNHTGYLENVIFTEFRVINRSTNIWNNFYLGIWNDDDAYIANSRVATDTLRNLGYSYLGSNLDPFYGSAPPAVGNKILRGLLKFTGNNSDTVKYFNPPGSDNQIKKIGYKDLKMTVSNRHNNSTPQPGSPYNSRETYRVLEGKWRDGSQWINPVTQLPTTYIYTGDPVSGTGWNHQHWTYRRTLQSTGPVNVNPGDTVSVLYAQLIARGTNNLNSITKLRETADFVQQIYNENFQSVVSVNNISSEVPAAYELFQNYPNPFNPSTKIKFNIPSDVNRQRSNVKLAVYDLIGREVVKLVDEILEPGSYETEFDGSNLSSGIYFYSINFDEAVFDTKKMLLLK